jgi:hypothetical protein
MAIIEPHRAGTSLSQGDILTGIRLYSSLIEADSLGPGTPEDNKAVACLIVSRQCVTSHKPVIVVAAVKKYQAEPKYDSTYEELEDFFKTIRDGVEAPDQFYLGHLPSMQGRYFAKLDSLHTLQIPKAGEQRQMLVDRCRIATLNVDYIRALHTRLFQAFANMGFEDHQWCSTEDLRLLVDKGQAEIRSKKDKSNFQAMAMDAAGRKQDKAKTESPNRAILDMEAKLQPYIDELQRRQLPSGSETGDSGPHCSDAGH